MLMCTDRMGNDKGLATESERLKFLCAVNDDQFEEIVSYNDLLNHLAEDDDNMVWKFII